MKYDERVCSFCNLGHTTALTHNIDECAELSNTGKKYHIYIHVYYTSPNVINIF